MLKITLKLKKGRPKLMRLEELGGMNIYKFTQKKQGKRRSNCI